MDNSTTTDRSCAWHALIDWFTGNFVLQGVDGVIEGSWQRLDASLVARAKNGPMHGGLFSAAAALLPSEAARTTYRRITQR